MICVLARNSGLRNIILASTGSDSNPLTRTVTLSPIDHKDILGDTLEEIAYEKAGIIKDNVPAVISQRQSEIEKIFIDKAKEHNAALTFASDEFEITQSDTLFEVTKNGILYLSELSLPLKGNYQAKNLGGVLKSMEILNQNGLTITQEKLREGLEKTVAQTGLKGRWQQLGTNPLIICDTGHNAGGVREVVSQINQQKFKNLFIVWGMVKDKEPDQVLSLLPKQARYCFCQASIPRAMDAGMLKQAAERFGLAGEVVRDVNQAIGKVKNLAGSDDFIFIGGSTFVVAEIENL